MGALPDDVAATVRHQLGIVGRRQVRSLGLADDAVTRRCASGELERVLPATYRHHAAHRDASQFTIAVATWLGDAGALSHLTAARVRGVERIPEDGLVHVVTPHRWLSPHAGVRVARAPLPDEDVSLVGVLRVTTIERTLIDSAALLTEVRLVSAIESAFHQGVTDPVRLEAKLVEMGTRGRKHAGRIRRWLELRGDGPALQSELEVAAARILSTSGLPVPTRQHRVVVDGTPYDLDFAWPEEMVALECDGWSAHGGRLAFDADRVRRGAVESLGWRVIPGTWIEVHRHPERLIRRIREALRTARRPLH
jgi:very-short-patch-repair endonuclease